MVCLGSSVGIAGLSNCLSLSLRLVRVNFHFLGLDFCREWSKTSKTLLTPVRSKPISQV